METILKIKETTFDGQYEFVNNNWIVTNKSLNQMLFK